MKVIWEVLATVSYNEYEANKLNKIILYLASSIFPPQIKVGVISIHHIVHVHDRDE